MTLSRTNICPLWGRVLVSPWNVRKIRTNEDMLHVSLPSSGRAALFGLLKSLLRYCDLYFGRDKEIMRRA